MCLGQAAHLLLLLLLVTLLVLPHYQRHCLFAGHSAAAASAESTSQVSKVATKKGKKLADMGWNALVVTSQSCLNYCSELH